MKPIMKTITSKDNNTLKLLSSLAKVKYRSQTGLFPAEGLRLVSELCDSGLHLEILACTQDFITSPEGEAFFSKYQVKQAFKVEPGLFHRLAETVNPQGVFGAFKIPQISEADIWHSGPTGQSFVLCLDRLQDPGNLGTIVRTCGAFGFSLVLSKGCVDLYNPKVIRASMGEVGKVPILINIDLAAFLRQVPQHIPVYVTDPHGSKALINIDSTQGCVLVVGNEANGVDPDLAKIVGRSYFIPMPGRAESLNVASAASVAVFEALRPYLSSMLSP